MSRPRHTSIGNRIAPARFILFGVALLLCGGVLVPAIGWRHGVMAAFDGAAALFLASLWPLLSPATPSDLRDHAAANDANRGALLAVTVAVSFVVLVAVGSELIESRGPTAGSVALIVGTLMLAWLFANMVYALHYAHIFYSQAVDGGGGDRGGLNFPDTQEPGYWEFVYFSFTLGMTFQTSDVEITATGMRRIVTAHTLAAFVFNLGVIAFSVNVLGR